MLLEAKVPVHFEQRLASVKKAGPRIREIAMENGNVFRAKVFIDCTYEGDLMAKAGVKYMVGREANARFGETLNGIRAETPKHQFLVPVDPYDEARRRRERLASFHADGRFRKRRARATAACRHTIFASASRKIRRTNARSSRRRAMTPSGTNCSAAISTALTSAGQKVDAQAIS